MIPSASIGRSISASLDWSVMNAAVQQGFQPVQILDGVDA
jgi:hypothetical protein